MSALAAALLADLTDADLDQLAEQLAPRLAQLHHANDPAPAWLDVNDAAKHIACPRSRLYALVSARRIPHHKDGSRLLFNAGELDEFIRAGGAKRP